MSITPKIVLTHPGGGCGNYILQNLCKVDIKFLLAYHDRGTHSNEQNNNGIYDIRNITDINRVKGILVVTNRYYIDIDRIKNYDKKTIQVYIDDYNELVVLNWFLKHDINTITRWENEQKKFWIGKYALEKAVCEWTTKMFDKNFIDIKRIPEIKEIFNFSSLYKNYNNSQKEFLKFGIDYNEHTHNNFLLSQKPILDVWKKILNNSKSNPLQLEEYFTRGIALALHQKQESIGREELYKKFNLNG